MPSRSPAHAASFQVNKSKRSPFGKPDATSVFSLAMPRYHRFPDLSMGKLKYFNFSIHNILNRLLIRRFTFDSIAHFCYNRDSIGGAVAGGLPHPFNEVIAWQP